MITVNKWFPVIEPTQHNIRAVAFEVAVAKVQEDYRQALKGHKLALATEALDVELYNKRASQNTIELSMFSNRKRFDSFT